jgi:hypothetical protein
MSDGAKVIYFPVSFFFSFGNICSLRTWSIIEHGSSAPHHIGSYIYSILFHAERISFKKKKERVDHQINFYIASPKKILSYLNKTSNIPHAMSKTTWYSLEIKNFNRIYFGASSYTNEKLVETMKRTIVVHG